MVLTKTQQLKNLLQSAIDTYHDGRADEAIQQLTQNSKAFPKSAKLWGYLGYLHGEVGADSTAAQAFRKAISLSPNSEPASLGLFHSLWRLGKTDAAFTEMRRFVKENDSPRYRQLLRDMLAEAPVERSRSDNALVVA